ncbi:CaiB/BaiF CoA transferase family protein [Ramlibacter sp. AN1015]|uniref:CaiB/BaiF CoA transferase family protein n=1 Tax=Ramlibacter sp. AN1015 TaxID=3133428 RepID=UPI0040407ED5
MTAKTGPLSGLKVIEMAGLGPAPMCAMLLADLGATVIRVDRRTPADLGIQRPRKYDLLLRNRDVIGVDLKDPAAIELVLTLVDKADILLEGFRPGVMERLGLGPDVALGRNGRLVYGRVTGYGQDGPLAQAAGHDLNYVAMAGAIAALGRPGQKPTVPISVIGDYGGGSLYLAFGVLAALFETGRSGKGQVVDAAMVDGVASLQTIFLGLLGAGMWQGERGNNLLDGGAHFYEVYECADGEFISVAAVEQRFYDELLERLEISAEQIGPHTDPHNWPKGKAILAERFKRRPRAEWCEILEGTDVCFAPVLSWGEAAKHPHLQQRGTFCEIEGVLQPAVAPRFSRTAPGAPVGPKEITSRNNTAALEQWLDADAVEALRRAGTIS